MEIQVDLQQVKQKWREGRKKFERCSRVLEAFRFHGRGNRGNGRKERNAERPRRTSAQVATDRDGQTNIESGGSTTCGLIHLDLLSLSLFL